MIRKTDCSWVTAYPEVIPGSPSRVRDVSRLGARRGQSSAVRSNRSENNERLRVRSERQLSRKSSKRIQTGEPDSVFGDVRYRSEEHTSELQSLRHLVCRL